MEDVKIHKSGAKTSGNPPPYECLTRSLLRRSAERMRLGMHYGKHNWEDGAKDKEYVLHRLAHAVEHLHKAMIEIDRDIPMTDDDLAAVVVNCMMAMEYQENIKKDLDGAVESLKDHNNIISSDIISHNSI